MHSRQTPKHQIPIQFPIARQNPKRQIHMQVWIYLLFLHCSEISQKSGPFALMESLKSQKIATSWHVRWMGVFRNDYRDST